jgi:hypothetical protein
MRLNIIFAASLLCTLVSGFVIPSRLSERDTDLVNSRRELLDFADDIAELAARGSKIKGQYNVAKGNGKQARESLTWKAFLELPNAHELSLETYKRKDVAKAVKLANVEKARLDRIGSKSQRKKSMLKPFGNNNHQVPKPGASGPNSLPKVKGGKLFEFPLRTAHQGPATTTDKGPTRVIMREDNRGKLRFKGVVAHDQERKPEPAGVPRPAGLNDHFEVKGRQGRVGRK